MANTDTAEEDTKLITEDFSSGFSGGEERILGVAASRAGNLDGAKAWPR